MVVFANIEGNPVVRSIASSHSPNSARPRGRPTQKRVAAINGAILRAARASFFEGGYSLTTMEGVAARAGVSKGTLYARYPDKPSLFTALVEDRVKSWAAEPSARSASDASMEEKLLHFAVRTLEKLAGSEVRLFTDFVLAESKRFPEVSRIFHRTAFLYGLSILAGEIAETAASEGVTVRNPEAVALHLLELLWGWFSFQILIGLEPDAAARLAAAQDRVSILIRGRASW
jgi:TetR/AcrR family transcriptional regulator, mexJK operon transcriptional repressor